MATFTIKSGDLLPVLEVVLRNPDGTVHDLTGTTTWKLHVYLGSGAFTRDMVKEGADTDGTLRYQWQAADWTGAPKLPTPASVYHSIELPMEYEVSGGISGTLTFPNSGYDKLLIRKGIG